MIYHKNFKLETIKYAILFIITVILHLSLNAQSPVLKAIPEEITFHNLEQEVQINLFFNNQPLKKENIKRWSFLAGSNQYNHMITLKPIEGGILVKPALLETGTYDLSIETSVGKYLITVYAPLDELPDTLENRAKREGITVKELKQRLGLASRSNRVNLSINVPEMYYEGQTLQIQLATDPEHFYVWRMNNQVITQGEGRINFEYTFPEAGEYIIEVEERDADIPLGKASSKTTVVAYPPVLYSATLKQPVKLSAIEGYNSYTWKVDGTVQKETSNQITLRFNAEKKYTVECIAKSPKNGHPDSFFRTVYEITVKK